MRKLRSLLPLGLKSQISLRFALIVLLVIALISLCSNLLIHRQFAAYMERQQTQQLERLADTIAYQYDLKTKTWNVDYIHGLGMLALDEGYILKVLDLNEANVWDAENHNMNGCHKMMDCIAERMARLGPDHQGNFVCRRTALKRDGQTVGYLNARFYGPYSLSDNDFIFLSALNKILLGVGALSLLGALLMGTFLASSIARPIRKTVEITQKIANGDYRVRFDEKQKVRELQDLQASVQQMAASLERQESLRKRLSSDIAHELRTPIANVSSYLEAMVEGAWEPSPERLQSCYEELQRLSSLVSELEQLRQTENENLELNCCEMDLKELASEVLASFAVPLEQKKLGADLSGPPVLVQANYSRMKQVVTNLLSNAVKYSREGGLIHMRTEETADSAALHVEDYGIGIPKDEQALIFERFYRTDCSRSRQTGGAGIGLTIAKSLITAHGGRLEVQSDEGKGSVFTVRLPRGKSEQHPS